MRHTGRAAGTDACLIQRPLRKLHLWRTSPPAAWHSPLCPCLANSSCAVSYQLFVHVPHKGGYLPKLCLCLLFSPLHILVLAALTHSWMFISLRMLPRTLTILACSPRFQTYVSDLLHEQKHTLSLGGTSNTAMKHKLSLTQMRAATTPLVTALHPA